MRQLTVAKRRYGSWLCRNAETRRLKHRLSLSGSSRNSGFSQAGSCPVYAAPSCVCLPPASVSLLRLSPSCVCLPLLRLSSNGRSHPQRKPTALRTDPAELAKSSNWPPWSLVLLALVVECPNAISAGGCRIIPKFKGCCAGSAVGLRRYPA